MHMVDQPDLIGCTIRFSHDRRNPGESNHRCPRRPPICSRVLRSKDTPRGSSRTPLGRSSYPWHLTQGQNNETMQKKRKKKKNPANIETVCMSRSRLKHTSWKFPAHCLVAQDLASDVFLTVEAAARTDSWTRVSCQYKISVKSLMITTAIIWVGTGEHTL